MKRLATALTALAVLLLCGSTTAWAQSLVFNTGPSAYGGAPNVPHIFMFESLQADTMFWGHYGMTPEDDTDRDYGYWADYAELGGDAQQGEGALWLDWQLFTDADWGGSSALQHFLPDTTALFYDFSDFTHINLSYNTLVPADPAATFRLKMQDASEGLGTAPSSETEDWYAEFSNIYQEQPGWKQISIPLESLGNVSPGTGGFSRPGCPSSCWSGIYGNGELDLDKVSGFQVEITAGQLGAAADSSTAGTIVFDNFYVSGVRYDLLTSFDSMIAESDRTNNGSGSHTLEVVADTTEGTGALQVDYHVVGDLSWGGSLDLNLRPEGGNTFAGTHDNTHLSLFYKVLEPASGPISLTFKIFDPVNAGMDWQYTVSNVLTDTSGVWRRLLMPLDAFKIPSWQNPPAGAELPVNNVTQLQIQLGVAVGGDASGKILFDRLTTYGFQETDFEAPAAPQGVDVTTSDFANIVSWTDVEGEESETYDIYFSTSPITDVTAEGVMVAVSNVEEGTMVYTHSLYAPVSDQQVTYYYAVTATDRVGNEGEATSAGSVTNTAKGLATISLSPPAAFAADGDVAEWSGITPIHVEAGTDLGYVPPSFMITDAADASGDVYLAMDDEALYVAFDIKDDKFFSVPEGSDAWNFDGAELYIGLYDWRGHKHTGLFGGEEPDYQINFYSNDQVTRSGLDGAIATSGDGNYSFTRTSDGYVIEAKLPYDSFAKADAPVFTPENGMRIPLDFKIMDNDDGGDARQGMLVYSFLDDDNAHLSPEYWFYTWVGDQFTVGVEQVGSDVPTSYALDQNYPNPFNPSTLIRYALPHAGKVSLRVYNVLGQEVMTLLDAPQAAGTYEVRFDASSLPSGVYFYQIRAGAFVQSKAMMLVR